MIDVTSNDQSKKHSNVSFKLYRYSSTTWFHICACDSRSHELGFVFQLIKIHAVIYVKLIYCELILIPVSFAPAQRGTKIWSSGMHYFLWWSWLIINCINCLFSLLCFKITHIIFILFFHSSSQNISNVQINILKQSNHWWLWDSIREQWCHLVCFVITTLVVTPGDQHIYLRTTA